MMIFSLVAMIGLEKCCITSACLQWLCHSGERTVARGPLMLKRLMCFENVCYQLVHQISISGHFVLKKMRSHMRELKAVDQKVFHRKRFITAYKYG